MRYPQAVKFKTPRRQSGIHGASSKMWKILKMRTKTVSPHQEVRAHQQLKAVVVRGGEGRLIRKIMRAQVYQIVYKDLVNTAGNNPFHIL